MSYRDGGIFHIRDSLLNLINIETNNTISWHYGSILYAAGFGNIFIENMIVSNSYT